MTSPLPTRFGIGQPVRRLEDARLITGRGSFTDDSRTPDALHAVFLRSPHAHADILRVDTAAAQTAPGVHLVLSGADLQRMGVKPLLIAPNPLLKSLHGPPRLALAESRVYHVGEAVAVVVADTAERARDAAELIDVDYAPLPAVTETDRAIAPDAPQLWPEAPGNVATTFRLGDARASDAAFAVAATVATIDLVNNRLVVNALEPRAAIAEPQPDGRLWLRIGCQGTQVTRLHLAEILGVPKESLRIISEDVGGGFGMKMYPYPEYIVISAAARQLGRTVRWRADRSESFLSDTQGRDLRSHAELAIDTHGRFLALRIRSLANMGGHLAFLGAVVPTVAGSKVATGPYLIPALDLEVRCVLTNTVPVEAYRGAGRPEFNYILERLIDLAARRSGIDRIELRRRNLIPPDALPYKSASGSVYDSGAFAAIMHRALDLADWNGFEDRRIRSEANGMLRGRGLACFIESTGANNPNEQVGMVLEGGRLKVLSGTQAMGQGIATGYAQVAADRLGIPIEGIDILQGDTDLIPVGGGSGGSRSMFVGGSAVAAAAELLTEAARKLAADALEASPADLVFAAGRFTVAGTDQGVDLHRLAAQQPDRRIAVQSKTTVQGMSWPNGCHVCEIEIERDTGVVRVDRFTAVDDVGVVINPMLVHGQSHGGIAQGIGQALIERCVYDPASGQLVTGSLLDYALPRADDFPEFTVDTDERAPCRTNPLGAKGAGESGAVGAPPAVINAVLDALAPFGVEHIDMPVTAEAVWRLMQKGTGT